MQQVTLHACACAISSVSDKTKKFLPLEQAKIEVQYSNAYCCFIQQIFFLIDAQSILSINIVKGSHWRAIKTLDIM